MACGVGDFHRARDGGRENQGNNSWTIVFVRVVILIAAVTAFGVIGSGGRANEQPEFNFGRYKSVDLDSFLNSHRALSQGGIDIVDDWEPVAFDAILEAPPMAWGAETIELVRRLRDPQLPEVSYGLLLRTKRNRLLMVHVQDVIAKSMLKEIEQEAQQGRKGPVGDHIRLWAIYVYNMSGDHGLIVNYAKTQVDTNVQEKLSGTSTLNQAITYCSQATVEMPSADRHRSWLAENSRYGPEEATKVNELVARFGQHYLDYQLILHAELSASGWFDIEGLSGLQEAKMSKKSLWACNEGENDYPLLFMIGVQLVSMRQGALYVSFKRGAYNIVSLFSLRDAKAIPVRLAGSNEVVCIDVRYCVGLSAHPSLGKTPERAQ
jgi:hypothetical protein